MTILNKKQLCETFGVSPQAVRNWVEQGCPCRRQARGLPGSEFDSAEVFRWRVARAEKREGAADYDHERTLHMKTKRQAAELELQQQRGELINRDEMAADYAKHIDRAKKRLLQLPTSVATQVAPVERVAEVRSVIERYVNEALAELAADE